MFAYVNPDGVGLVFANVTASTEGVVGDTILDFATGVDSFEFESSDFGGLSVGTLSAANFATIDSSYDGTNSGLADETTAFVYSTFDDTLSFDPATGSNTGDEGYSVVATAQNGAAVIAHADIEIVSF